MRLTVACVGKPSGYAKAGVDDYLARIARYAPVQLKIVRAEPDADRAPAVAARREGERLCAVLPEGAQWVALHPAGKTLDSMAFAKWLGQRQDGGVRDVAFAVGGPVGHGEALLKDAALKLSLSPMTLPHELALLVLCEQLYRAFTILRGERYHKE